MRRAIGEAHRGYTRRINFREKWRGYLWQGRFASFVMDEPYLLAAARYVELNPVRANLVGDAADWPWSSAKAHLLACNDHLVQVASMLAMVNDWRAFLDSLSGQRDARRAVAGLAQPFPHRSTARRRNVRRTLRETRRSRPLPTKTRPKANVYIPQTAKIGIVSPDSMVSGTRS